MSSVRILQRLDMRVIFIILLLMAISCLTISSYSFELCDELASSSFLTPLVKTQIKWFVIGWILFFTFASLDYNKFREYAWPIYVLSIISLIGLFFVSSIARVNRWYTVPVINFHIQPSETAKLAVTIALSWFLERRANSSRSFGTTFGVSLIMGIPFLLILKQPDLGTALVLFPMLLVMGYFGDLHPYFLRFLSAIGLMLLAVVFCIFSGLVPYESIKPYAMKVIKEYQFERLNPATHHQKCASTAIAIGGFSGVGFRNSEYAKGGSLPAPYTDSIFSAFGEEFGFLGLTLLLFLYYCLIWCSFQVTAVAKDPFGRLLAAGIAVFLAVHVLVNIGMMCGLLPITGVPLVLLSYGGSSILSTMMALGILQSIYTRRFMF